MPGKTRREARHRVRSSVRVPPSPSLAHDALADLVPRPPSLVDLLRLPDVHRVLRSALRSGEGMKQQAVPSRVVAEDEPTYFDGVLGGFFMGCAFSLLLYLLVRFAVAIA